MVRITQKQETKPGTIVSAWPPDIHCLILEHGYNYSNLSELFESLAEFGEREQILGEKVSSDLDDLEIINCPFDEFICFVMGLYYEKNFFQCRHILNYLLFSENLTVSHSVLIFLQKNQFLAQLNKIELYSGLAKALVGRGRSNVNPKKLLNFLTFLEIRLAKKQELIQSCNEVNHFSPLLSFIKKERDLFVKQQKNKSIQKKITVNTK